MRNYKIGLIFSIFLLSGVLVFSSAEDGFSLKSKGTSLTEVGSKMVCGDKLCSEINLGQSKFFCRN